MEHWPKIIEGQLEGTNKNIQYIDRGCGIRCSKNLGMEKI